MPNHVQNILKIKNVKNTKELIDRFTTLDEESNRYFDFNKIIPMPKSLLIESSSYEIPAIKLALYYKTDKDRYELIDKINSKSINTGVYIEKMMDLGEISEIKKNEAKRFEPDEIEKELGGRSLSDLGRIYINNILNYGYANWYKWSLANWGTKWNSYENYIDVGKTWVKFSFQTAWATPLLIFDKLSELIDNDMEIWFADEDIGYNCGKIYYINKEQFLDIKENDKKFAYRVWKM